MDSTIAIYGIAFMCVVFIGMLNRSGKGPQ